jgi:hypothetical protein
MLSIALVVDVEVVIMAVAALPVQMEQGAMGI